jgi:hypothetical protein
LELFLCLLFFSLFFLEDSWGFFGDFRELFEDDLTEVFVFFHVSEFFGPVELEDVGEDFVDEPGGVDFLVFPVSGGGRIIGHTAGNFEEESDISVIFDEETEEVGEVDEALEFLHVMLEAFFSVGIFPVLNRLRSEPEDLIDAIELTERFKNVHFGNVTKLFLTRVIIRILDVDIDNVVFVFDLFEFHVGVDFGDVFDGDSG